MTKKGFSLLEVGVALLILSVAVTAVFQFISSTTLSVFAIENRAYAREIANNRMALIQTLEPFSGQSKRSGESEFGGKIFYWSEEIINASNEFNQLNIYVGIDKDSIIYELNTFIEKQ
jgi:general secretion pathway protein I|tara:strand:+ start:239 stop:592 length:354 start_codon:yes stop_codon:yes gene_type:complete